MPKTDKHTPGPWTAIQHGEDWWQVLRGAWDIGDHFDPAVIASAHYSAMTAEENAGNARLIAAAPTMLDALRESVRTIEWLYGVGTIARDAKEFDPHAWEEAMRFLVQARAAIAAATEEAVS